MRIQDRHQRPCPVDCHSRRELQVMADAKSAKRTKVGPCDRSRAGSTAHDRHRPVITPGSCSQWLLAIHRRRWCSANDQRRPPAHALGHSARTSTIASIALASSPAATSRRGPCPTIPTPTRLLTACGSQFPIVERAAPPFPFLPAVSSPQAYQTPAIERAAPSVSAGI